jgi:uncharacterized membrane protein
MADMSSIATAAALAAGLAAGIAGGVYFTFSAIVMPGLRGVPAAQAMSAMQSVNRSAVRLPFMTVFFGGAAASVAVFIFESTTGALSENGAGRMLGAGLSLLAFGITVGRNVPLNEALARVPEGVADATGAWNSFDRGWTRANLARGAASIVGASLLIHSLWRG